MGWESIDIADVAMPDLKSGSMLVKAAYCAALGSDREEFWYRPVMLPMVVPSPDVDSPVWVGQKASLGSMPLCR